MEMTNLQYARSLAEYWHRDQKRRDGVTPYFSHVEDVARRCAKYGEEEQIVAFLHDSLEDTEIGLDAFNVFSEEIFVAILLLTKNDMMDYDEYIQGVAKNELARRVKVEDMLSNLSDNPTNKQIRKYAKALLVLVPS